MSPVFLGVNHSEASSIFPAPRNMSNMQDEKDSSVQLRPVLDIFIFPSVRDVINDLVVH